MANLAANNWPVKIITLGALAGQVSPEFANGIPDPPSGQYFHPYTGDLYGPVPKPFTGATASIDTRKIYLSHELGDNNFDGLAPTPQGGNVGPKKTADAAFPLMRQGMPDHLLIRRGEFEDGRPKWWDIRHFTVSNATRGGRSNNEPSVIGWYGTGHKPRVAGPQWIRDYQRYIHVIGLHFYHPQGVIGDPLFNADYETFSLLNNPSDILVEDCWTSAVEYTVQDQNNVGMQNIRYRYCNLVDPVYYKDSGINNNKRPSFMYSSGIKGLQIEGCVMMYPGWHPLIIPGYGGDETIGGASANMFNHGFYIGESNQHEGTVAFHNLIGHPSAHGWQFRSGCDAYENIVYGAAIGTSAGYYNRDDPLKGLVPDGRMHRMRRNVLLTGRTMHRMVGGCNNGVCTGAIWGLDVGVNNIKAIYEVMDNIVAGITFEGTTNPPSVNIGSFRKGMCRYQTLPIPVIRERNNLFWHFDSSTQGDELNYPDPGRSLSHAMAELGNAQMTDEQVMITLKNRDTYAWNEKLSMPNIISHIERGYRA